MLSRAFQRFLGRIDAGDDRARRSERLGEDSSPATDVERALAAEPSEHPAEVLHADDIQLVQARERPGATPPDVRRGLDQSLVFVGLGQTPDPGKSIAHVETLTPITNPSRRGAPADATRRAVAPSQAQARRHPLTPVVQTPDRRLREHVALRAAT